GVRAPAVRSNLPEVVRTGRGSERRGVTEEPQRAATTSLTQMQLLGVGSDTNVAEGYPRFAPTPRQSEILARLPELMAEALRTPYPVLEARAHASYLHAVGQLSAPVGSGRILSFYASTIA